jgi:hypothetical protein
LLFDYARAHQNYCPTKASVLLAAWALLNALLYQALLQPRSSNLLTMFTNLISFNSACKPTPTPIEKAQTRYGMFAHRKYGLILLIANSEWLAWLSRPLAIQQL